MLNSFGLQLKDASVSAWRRYIAVSPPLSPLRTSLATVGGERDTCLNGGRVALCGSFPSGSVMCASRAPASNATCHSRGQPLSRGSHAGSSCHFCSPLLYSESP